MLRTPSVGGGLKAPWGGDHRRPSVLDNLERIPCSWRSWRSWRSRIVVVPIFLFFNVFVRLRAYVFRGRYSFLVFDKRVDQK